MRRRVHTLVKNAHDLDRIVDSVENCVDRRFDDARTTHVP